MAVEISILLSVYNPEWMYFQKMLDSIKNQTYKEYELVVINDGCDSEMLLKYLEPLDFPVKVVNNQTNLGLPKSLNRGLQKCEGKYIARIDDDDFMLNERLELQYKFMEEHPEMISVLSNVRVIGANGELIREDKRDHNNGLRGKLLYIGNCLYHSTLFARKEILEQIGGYDEKMIYAQDYDLYLRLINRGEIYVLPQMLVSFRTVPERISKNKHILSALFAYYASLKNMNGFHLGIFWSRTILTIRSLIKLLKK